jgi:uncharacterized protein (TIGR00369 family)
MREKMQENVGQTEKIGGRSRTVTWQDPFILANLGGTASGLELLQRMVRGELPPPPIAELLGFRLVQVEPGFACFEIEPAEYHYNPIGVVHGGVAGIMLDSAMGCSVHTTLPPNTAYTTLEFKVNLVRAVTKDTGLLRCEGRLVYGGKRAATAEGKLVDREGKLYAHGTTTCMIIPLAAERG